MHIPDNYLSPVSCAAMGAFMLPIWSRALKKLKNGATDKKIPLMGIGAALSFLIMMFNVPLPGGTSGHAIGGTLLAIVLGPEAACISITIALLIQALLFGDGGILAFGANCFNISFIAPFTGYYIYKVLKDKAGDNISAFMGGYAGINIAAFFAALEFGIQPLLFKGAAGMPLYSPYPLSITIPAMMIPHLLIAGVLEAIITAGVLQFIKRVSPGIIYQDSKIKMRNIYMLIAALIILSPIGLFASGTAFGEWSLEEISSVTAGGKPLGFVPKGMQEGFSLSTLIPDYSIKGLPEITGYILSAAAGAALLLIIFRVIAASKKDIKG